MIPFARILKYDNKVIPPKPIIKKVINYTNTLFVLYSTGELYGCGANSTGELGLGDTTNRTSLTLLSTGVDDVWNGANNTLIRKGSSYYLSGVGTCIGSTNVSRLSFTDITSLLGLDSSVLASITKIELSQTLSILSGSVFYGCGLNNQGQLGIGTATRISTPQVMATGVSNIFDNGGSGIYYISGSRIYSCGLNAYGQLADGTVNTRSTFFAANSTVGLNANICAFSRTTASIYYNTNLYVSGAFGAGVAGNGLSTGNSVGFSSISSLKPVGITQSNIYNSTSLFCSPIFVLSTGIYRSGNNTNGELGDGTVVNSTSYKLLGSNIFTDLSKLNTVCAGFSRTYIAYDNKLYFSGDASNSCAPGYTTNQTQFVQISTPY